MKTSQFHEISFRAEELSKCTRCGVCHSVCPVYLADSYEGKSAKGKIVLLTELLDNSLEPNGRIAKIFDDCLTCHACRTVCPAGVRTDRLWAATREDLKGKSLTTWIKRRIIRFTIGKPKLFNISIGAVGSMFGRDKELLKNSSATRGFFPFRGAPYSDLLESEYPPEGRSIGRVGLLVGCSSNIFAPSVVDASIRLLNACGFTVCIPNEQVCCGIPAINNGDWDTARKLAQKNINIFIDGKYDFVTSCDSTCASTLKSGYLDIFSGFGSLRKDAELLSEKTIQLSNLLMKNFDKLESKLQIAQSDLAVHNSCHEFGDSNWSEILENLSQINTIDFENSSHCCGFGGSFSIMHSKTAAEIAEKKLSSFVESGAKKILIGSPGCCLHLKKYQDSLKYQDLKLEHVTDFLSSCLD